MRHGVGVTFGCLGLVLCSTIHGFAKEWRGIVPLRTTRAEVVKLLGAPRLNPETGVEYFDLSEERVRIGWVDPTCEREYPVEPESAVRPADVVWYVSIFRKQPLPLKELGPLPVDGFMTVGCHPNGPCTLWSGEAGFGFASTSGGITRLYYAPTADEFEAWSAGHKSCEQKRGITFVTHAARDRLPIKYL